MKIQESAENYLETILILGQDDNPVRSIDIVNELKFSKPSVSVAMKNLRERNLVEIDSAGHITLTKEGRKIAESVYERHVLLSSWLIQLGVDKEIAANDACGMEHSISEESYLAIKKHIEEHNSNSN